MNYSDRGGNLPKFGEWKPTRYDTAGLGSDGQESWRVLPVMRTRDSGPLDVSNFEAATKMLDDAGADYDTHRYGHWGPGWFEVIAVEPTRKGLAVAGEIACALEDCPILDEDGHSRAELEAAWESWEACAHRDVVHYWDDEVSERGLDYLLSDAGSAELYMLGSERCSGYAYEGESPYYDLSGSDFTRNDIARAIRAARKAEETA